MKLKNYSHKLRHILITAFLLLLQITAQNARSYGAGEPVGINRAIEIALQQNLEIAAERKRFEEAEARLLKASQRFPSNPRIETEIGTRNSPEDRHTDYSVSLSQEVEIFGQRRKRLRVANKNMESVKFKIMDSEREIIAKVKSIFYQALTDIEVVKLGDQAAGILARLRDAMRERHKAGAISAFELNSIQIQYGLAMQRLNNAKNEAKNTMMDLKSALGLEKDAPFNIMGDLSYKPVHINLDDLTVAAFKQRPDLKAVEFERETATAEISLRRSEIIPNPELSGFFDREEGSDDIVGGKMSISIPIWDRKQSERKRAGVAKDIAEINIEGKRRQIHNEVESAFRAFKTAVESINIFNNEIIPQVDDNLNLNEISYTEGKINFIEFLTTQNNLIETKAIYLDALLNYNKAIINLETATGSVIGAL